MLGIEYQDSKLILNPLLSDEEESIRFTLGYLDSQYSIDIQKPKGLYRVKDFNYAIRLDNELLDGNTINLNNDGSHHYVEIKFY